MLERAQLVRRRREWREHWLSANPEPLAALATWLEHQRGFWCARLDNLDAALRQTEQPQ
jgi:hypothetical protein